MTRHIEIVEVGPRDGLQNEKAILDAADKVAFVRRLEAAGARRLEAVSFVNPRAGAADGRRGRDHGRACARAGRLAHRSGSQRTRLGPRRGQRLR